MQRKNILVVYAAYPTRATLLDSLHSFRRYSAQNVFYLNLRLKRVPWYVRTVKFDLIIFHTLFFAGRFEARYVRNTFERAAALASVDAVKIMLPQDEFINADVVNEFIDRFGINCVFSVQPEHEWSRIYNSVEFDRVRFYRVLSGYLDDNRVEKISQIQREEDRVIDIGYRTAGEPPPWFGRQGLLKRQIADVFAAKGKKKGLYVDISTSPADTLLGDGWYRFLCRCKYVLGVEGGTSILDRDGSIKQKTEEYGLLHAGASFEEIEQACFPGLDGTFRGYAISPRHLEACAARVCQVLTEGFYNGILLPGHHYIEVKRDFSNVDDVLETVVRDDLRKQITSRAYEDIVASDKYTYRSFVNFVIEHSIDLSVIPQRVPLYRALWMGIVYGWMRYVELMDRLIAVVHGRVFTPLRQRFVGR